MSGNKSAIRFDRCSLCRSEYIRIEPYLLSLDYIRSMNKEDFKDLVIQVLEEHGYDVFESDKVSPEKSNSFLLESHKAEKHRWHVKSWSLFECRKENKPVDLEEVKKFYDLVLSDNAESGYVITTSNFTEDSVKFVIGKPLELIDGKAFLSLLIKASSSGEHCTECMGISPSIRASLKNLRARIEAFNRLEHEISGKWIAPLNLDLMLGDIVRKIKISFKTASKLGKKRLETKLPIKINNIISSIARMTRGIKSFEKMVQEFTKEEK